MNFRLTEEGERIRERIRDNKLLVAGILIGIIGSLIAGVTNDLIRNSPFYPWQYLIILLIVLFILIYFYLREYFKLKIYLFKCNRLIKEGRRYLINTRQPQPLKSQDN